MPFDHINPHWLADKMKEHNISKSELAEALKVRLEQPGRWLKGKPEMAHTTKALIHYYFLNLECQKSRNER